MTIAKQLGFLSPTAVLGTLLLPATSHAQLSIDVTAVEDIVVVENIFVVSRRYVLPKLTKIKNGAKLGATFGKMTFQHSVKDGRIKYAWTASVAGGMQDFSTADATVLLRLRSAKPIAGRVIVRFTWTGYSTPRFTTVHTVVASAFGPQINLAKQNRFEKSFRVTLDAKGIQLAHRSKLAASIFYPTVGMHAELSFEFVPDVWFQNYGIGCGPNLSGSFDNKSRITLLATNMVGSPSGLAALFFGVKNLRLRIPGTNCYGNTDFLFAVPLTVDARGNATRVFAKPKGDFYLNAQVISLDARSGALTLSDGLTIGIH